MAETLYKLTDPDVAHLPLMVSCAVDCTPSNLTVYSPMLSGCADSIINECFPLSDMMSYLSPRFSALSPLNHCGLRPDLDTSHTKATLTPTVSSSISFRGVITTMGSTGSTINNWVTTKQR